MSLVVDFFYSFRSPYSYLAVPRVAELARTHELDVRMRIVLPLAVRDPGFFDRVNPLWPAYLLRDTIRLAEFHGIGYHWPRPDPVVRDLQAGGRAAAEQPYIHRISRLGVRAEELGRGLEFVHEAARVIWDGSVVGWHEGDHLAGAAARAGLDLAEMEAAIEADPARYAAAIEANQKALEQAGHWGVPTFVHESEPFFGQDRIELLVWRLERRGLQRRRSE